MTTNQMPSTLTASGCNAVCVQESLSWKPDLDFSTIKIKQCSNFRITCERI